VGNPYPFSCRARAKLLIAVLSGSASSFTTAVDLADEDPRSIRSRNIGNSTSERYDAEQLGQ
jgi:hypothetical protein